MTIIRKTKAFARFGQMLDAGIWILDSEPDLFGAFKYQASRIKKPASTR